MSEPLRPNEIGPAKAAMIPHEVINAVNELLTSKFVSRKRSVIIHQCDIVRLAKAKMDPGTRFDYEWLNFEGLFESYGWKVTYDKPAYCENYEPSFEFTAKE